MKTAKLLAGLALSAAASLAFALDIQPYAAETLAARQKAADWCPTGRAQEKVFNGWKGDAAVPGTLLVVNFDKERELKRQLGVRSQSTVIVYKGGKETGRLAGETDPAPLRAVLGSAK